MIYDDHFICLTSLGNECQFWARFNWALIELKCQAQTLARAVGVPVRRRSRRSAFGWPTGYFQLVPVHAENV